MVEIRQSIPANCDTNSTLNVNTLPGKCMEQVLIKVIIRRAPWSHCREQTDPWAIWSKKLFTPFWSRVNGVQSPKHRDSEKHWVQTPHDLLKQWISRSWWLSKITYIVKGLWSVQPTLLCSTICFYIGVTPLIDVKVFVGGRIVRCSRGSVSSNDCPGADKVFIFRRTVPGVLLQFMEL